MSWHYQTKHPREYEELMKDHTAVAEGRSNVVKAVGGLVAFRELYAFRSFEMLRFRRGFSFLHASVVYVVGKK